MDMLILRPLDTLKQGQRWWVAGMKDLWENEEDKSKAWQNERMPFWKGIERCYLLFCPHWIFLLLENWLLRVNQRKKEGSTVFPSCFFVIIISTVTGRDSEAYLHTSESSFAYQTHRKADSAASMCGGEMEECYFYIQLESRFDAEARWSWGRQAPLAVSRFWGELLRQRRFLRWRTWERNSPFTYGGYQLFIKD